MLSCVRNLRNEDFRYSVSDKPAARLHLAGGSPPSRALKKENGVGARLLLSKPQIRLAALHNGLKMSINEKEHLRLVSDGHAKHRGFRVHG